MLFIVPPAIVLSAPLWQEAAPKNDAVVELVLPLIEKAKEKAKVAPKEEDRAGAWLKIAEAERKIGRTEAAKSSLDAALKALRAMPPTERESLPFLLAMLAHAYSSFGDTPTSQKLFEEATTLGAKTKEPMPRFYVLSMIASTRFERDDSAGGKATFALALKGLTPALAKGDEVIRAQADVQGRSGDIPGAKKTSAKMKDIANRALFYQGLSIRQVKKGDTAGAKATMAEGVQIALTDKEEGSRRMILSILLQEMAKQGDVEAAKKRAGNKPELLKAIAEGQLEAGDLAGAKKTYGKPFPAMVYGLANAGEIDAAKKMLTDPEVKLGVSMQDEELRMLGAIAAGQAKKGDDASARATLAEAEKKATTPDDFFGDKSALLLTSLIESILTGGKREW